MIDQLLSRPDVPDDTFVGRERDEPFPGEGTPRLVSLMGIPNHAPDGDIMGGADRGPRIDLMGAPDGTQFVGVMGGPDRSPRLGLMGESDIGFVDSLFTARSDIRGDRRPAQRQQTSHARRRRVLRGLASGATLGA